MWVIKNRNDFTLLGHKIPNPKTGEPILEVAYLFPTEKKAKSFLKARHRKQELNKKDYEIIYQGGK